MKKKHSSSHDTPLVLGDCQLAHATGGALDLGKLFPTLDSAKDAVADLQGEADGGPYHPGGSPPDYGNLIK